MGQSGSGDRLAVSDQQADRSVNTPTDLARVLTRSSGAIANVLAKFAAQGKVTPTNERPRRYRVVGMCAKTADRSVLGCMNDMAYLCEDAVAHAGSLTKTDVRSLNCRLRRNINSARSYQRPIDLIVERTTR